MHKPSQPGCHLHIGVYPDSVHPTSPLIIPCNRLKWFLSGSVGLKAKDCIQILDTGRCFVVGVWGYRTSISKGYRFKRHKMPACCCKLNSWKDKTKDRMVCIMLGLIQAREQVHSLGGGQVKDLTHVSGHKPVKPIDRLMTKYLLASNAFFRLWKLHHVENIIAIKMLCRKSFRYNWSSFLWPSL